MKSMNVQQIFHHATADDPPVAVYYYKVMKVVNSMTPYTSSTLSPNEMSEYIDDADWKVTIT